MASASSGIAGVAAVNGAIRALARTLAAELALRRVDGVSPGSVDTPAYAGWRPTCAGGFYAGRAAKLPVGRIGTAEDVADVIVAVPASGFMTGAMVDVDGGATLARGRVRGAATALLRGHAGLHPERTEEIIVPLYADLLEDEPARAAETRTRVMPDHLANLARHADRSRATGPLREGPRDEAGGATCRFVSRHPAARSRDPRAAWHPFRMRHPPARTIGALAAPPVCCPPVQRLSRMTTRTAARYEDDVCTWPLQQAQTPRRRLARHW